MSTPAEPRHAAPVKLTRTTLAVLRALTTAGPRHRATDVELELLARMLRDRQHDQP